MSLIKKEKLEQFYKFLNSTSLGDVEKRNIKFLIGFLDGKHINKLTSRSFLFHGNPGIGKTYVAEKLLEVIDMPIFYLGCAKLKNQNIKQFKNLNELAEEVENEKNKDFVIFIDDMNSVFEFDSDCDEIDREEQKRFMKVLERIKRSNDKTILLSTLNRLDFMESILDRIEIKIEFDLPSDENKLDFLKDSYSLYLKKEELECIARNSIGYNYRDLSEVVKLAYREGFGKINTESIKKALTIYEPTSLLGQNIERGIKLTLRDIDVNDKIKTDLRRMMLCYRNRDLAKKLGLKRANLLIFSGLPGTGKTFCARAFAGELGYPLIHLFPAEVLNGPVSLGRIINRAKRFRNCVVFVDEVEKIMELGRFDEEGPIFAALDTAIEGVDDKEIEAIVIFAVNEKCRVGEALKDRFNIIEFGLPSYKERYSFLNKKINKHKILRQKINGKEIARLTDGFSFRDLERIWNDAAFYFLEKRDTITTDIFKNFIMRLKEAKNYRTYDPMFG